MSIDRGWLFVIHPRGLLLGLPGPMRSGHLFVVHGEIENLLHDAAVLAVGSELWLAEYWTELLPRDLQRTLRPEKPAGWERGWGRIRESAVWMVDIGGETPEPHEVILSRISGAIEAAARDVRASALRSRRRLPLVALPFIGLGRTGYGDQRGQIVKELVGHLSALTRRAGIDIALVTPDSSVYAAAQFARRGLLAAPDEKAAELGAMAKDGRLALFLGAGVSMSAGLPSWSELIDTLAERTDLDHEKMQQLSATDQAELIELSGRSQGQQAAQFQRRVAEIVGGKRPPSLVHCLLAGLDCANVVTTNYDLLYEGAVKATRREITAVMPWSTSAEDHRWILKLHGDVDHPETIVLTRRHMVMYDAANRPSGALLQSLLLTKSLLVVGASMTDDNVIRLAHEVQAYREHHRVEGAGVFGTVLAVGPDDLRGHLWKGQLDWVTMRGEVPERVRSLEIFLDEVALHASRDSSWLLDARFDGLHASDEDRQIAAAARHLLSRLDESGTWRPLAERLRQLGAGPPDN